MDKRIIIKISDDMQGRTVKHILESMDFSSTIIRRLKKSQDGIMLCGERVHTDRRVKTGDELVLNMYDKPSENVVPKDIPLDIIYEDEDIIAVNKPRAMPTHPSQNHHDDTLANALMHYFRHSDFTFRAITRLDADTSGVVLVAKNAFTAQILNDEIKNQRIHKEYIAVVNGILTPQKGTVDAPIERVENSVILRHVSPNGKTAVTEYSVLNSANGLSLVALRPITGRTHQLRVHMSHIGAPIYGDDLYGAPQKDEMTRLHCARIVFNHPVSKNELIIQAPLPQDMTKIIEEYTGEQNV